MTNRVVWLICRKLIDIGRQRAVPCPDIYEIVHYAICSRCRNDIEVQGWRVEFKHEKKEIYEVTFKAMENEESRHLTDECFEDEEEEDEEEEFKVRRPKRLIVGEERPKRPKADFYV